MGSGTAVGHRRHLMALIYLSDSRSAADFLACEVPTRSVADLLVCVVDSRSAAQGDDAAGDDTRDGRLLRKRRSQACRRDADVDQLAYRA